jgi:hypothetical protein
MQAPPVLVNALAALPSELGAPGLVRRGGETWEIMACATSFTGIISCVRAPNSSTGVTIE